MLYLYFQAQIQQFKIVRPWKGYRDIGQNKGVWDILVNEILGSILGILGIQCFLNLGDICHIYFRDMGYFSK